MKINNYEEKQMYLNYNIKGKYGSYALVIYNNEPEPIWFEKSEELNYDGEYSFQERMLDINKIDYSLIGENVADELEDIVRNKKDKFFSINKSLFMLPNFIDDITLITKEYLYEWLLHKEIKSYVKWEVLKVDGILSKIPIGSEIVCKISNQNNAVIGKLTDKEGDYIEIEYPNTKETISKVCIENIYLLENINNNVGIAYVDNTDYWSEKDLEILKNYDKFYMELPESIITNKKLKKKEVKND